MIKAWHKKKQLQRHQGLRDQALREAPHREAPHRDQLRRHRLARTHGHCAVRCSAECSVAWRPGSPGSSAST
jgi:hypothetical protein